MCVETGSINEALECDLWSRNFHCDLKRHETSVEPATSTENTESRHCLSCQMLKPLLENAVQMT